MQTQTILYIFQIGSIPEDTKIIVNGDDIIASMIKSEVKDDKIDLNTKMKAFYGMERQENDTNTPKNLVRDIIVCPICNEKLEYDYIQLNHHRKMQMQ